jgi:putative heme-binding domain-containing protein
MDQRPPSPRPSPPGEGESCSVFWQVRDTAIDRRASEKTVTADHCALSLGERVRVRAGVTIKLMLALLVIWICHTTNSRGQTIGRSEKLLVIVSNPPPVQMLVPGFTVRELPLEVNNINNLVFAPDGRLFAFCYDGNVLQLKDANGDGLEDTATHFYKNDVNEILPSIGMCWGPSGLYIASQGRVIRLRDQGDGTGELETVTSGWVPPASAAGSNLDAVGIAANRAGEIYFGLGCDAWNQAYRINKDTGKSGYNLRSERGTILKILPDGKREVICTGMRFPVGMAFNAAGDLFTTDQEGATWLPNGNPLDELLHIQPGRHYGFPPRHPKHLPTVIDEPSTFDYGPQHQSTCGIHFNDGPKVFGPEWWRGDAIITGQSRGKIWRTKLVTTAAGYVAQNHLIACLSLLTIDAVPTPQGDLLVACHTGDPDWGTGPQGKGRLFKISYTDEAAPQPVLSYARSSTEMRVIFDRPLEVTEANDLAKHCNVTMGRFVAAGDRFESFSPGYQAVKNQRTMPRFELPVTQAHWSEDQRELVIATTERTEAVNYAITLPGAISRSREAVDVQTDLTGAEVNWRSATGADVWTGWLPHLDLTAARGLVVGSETHQKLFKLLKRRGTLTLRTKLDLGQMLRAESQPDSKLDFEYPGENVTLAFTGNGRVGLKAGANVLPGGGNTVRIHTQPKANRWLPLEITLATGFGEPRLDVSWFTAEDVRPRPLPRRRIYLPWAQPYLVVVLASRPLELESASWQRGKEIFFGEQAACSKCHKIGGEGGTIGADLSNLIYRDYASVWKDIIEPSAAINPDHLAYNVYLTDGEMETGVILKNNRDEVVLGQVSGKNLTIPKTKVTSLKAGALSLMPEGLLSGLTEQQQRDLMKFLLTAH